MSKLIYDFPVINTLDDVLPAIAGKDEFFVKDNVDHFIVNYQFNTPDSFENPNEPGISEEEANFRKIRKECRGMIFGADRKIISRPFHKFHNLNERPEYLAESIDLSVPHKILDKLDGSMIRPYYIDGALYWGTKMGHNTEVARWATEFVLTHPAYIKLAEELLAEGYTPIFEYCSRKNRIVIDHPKDRMVLLAIRNMETGNYLHFNPADIPEVETIHTHDVNITDIAKLAIDTKALENTEGFVIRFDTGHMIKLKADQYVLLHKTKDQITLEKNVLRTILEDGIDDLIPLLEPDLQKRLVDYTTAVFGGIGDTAILCAHWVGSNKALSQKDFAIKTLEQHPQFSNIMFKVRAGNDVIEEVKGYVLKHTSSINKVEVIRPIIKAKWKEFFLEE